jgi:hypothetical protein
LESAPGIPASELAALRAILAASLIQQNPGPLPDDPDINPEIRQALQDGAEIAVERGPLRVVGEDEANPSDALEMAAETFGPFIDPDGRIGRFLVFEGKPFLRIHAMLPFAPVPGELLFLVPPDSVIAPDDRSITIPGGAVWIRSRFLVAGAAGYVGLRVSGGAFVTSIQMIRSGELLVMPNFGTWTLTVQPAQAPPTGGAGSDAESLSLTLPSQLEVRSNAEVSISGNLAISGFGSDLEFTPSSGAPFLDAPFGLSFPLTAPGPAFQIAGNRSQAVQFNGEASTTAAVYRLPLLANLPASPADAPHGGSVVVRLTGAIAAEMFAQLGTPFVCFDSVLTANERYLELAGLQVLSGARFELDLWSPARTEANFGEQAVNRVLFRSVRGRDDLILASGGLLRNWWDLPLTADNKPLPFEGSIHNFGFIDGPRGLLAIASASQQAPENRIGITLENVYLVTRPPSRLALLGLIDPGNIASAGASRLNCDTFFVLPTLPDPYVTNVETAFQGPFGGRVSIGLRWDVGESPHLNARFLRPPRFPAARPEQTADPDEAAVREHFQGQLQSQMSFISLLDLSSRQFQLGVAMEDPSDSPLNLDNNRLSVPLSGVRLLMQPQVQWEPVRIIANQNVTVSFDPSVASTTNGGPTLVGANNVKLVPVLPSPVIREIVTATREKQNAAALFSLPFGMRAYAKLSPPDPVGVPIEPPGINTDVHEPSFGTMQSATQLRLRATTPFPPDSPQFRSRHMPGMARQLGNFQQPNNNGLESVLPNNLRVDFNNDFASRIPLHRADLSGYGLSTFSRWSQDVEIGFIQVRFDVMNGRTSYEVIEKRGNLFFCESPVVRTIILERTNAGKVLRYDSGWDSVDSGRFEKPIQFERGLVKAFHNIRNIRIIGGLITLADGISAVEPVLYDADVEFEASEELVSGGVNGLVPIRDQAGYVQTRPNTPFTPPQLIQLFNAAGGATGGPADCGLRVAKILETQLTGIFAGKSSDIGGPDDPARTSFAVAVYGALKLPRAGQWSTVRVDPFNFEASPVDARRGMPIVRRPGQVHRFRDPSDLRREPPVSEYGLLLTTQTSRVLFPKPFLNEAQPGRLSTSNPIVADPYSLAQSTSSFPRAAMSLQCTTAPFFNIAGDVWKISDQNIGFTPPVHDLVKSSEWALSRVYDAVPPLKVLVDSASAVPWEFNVPPVDLNLDLPAPFNTLFKVKANYQAVSGGIPKLKKPTLEFLGPLEELKKTMDALSNLAGLPFDIDVDVTAAGGASAAFVIRIRLIFRIGEGPNERIDIGIGKFHGQFLIEGQIETALTGIERALLKAEFSGDLQQGIIPPLIYGGGLFKFLIEIRDKGRPTVLLALGVVASIGGDLIKGLIEVEVTVKYGYVLIPETLEPGVLLGLEARAKLLAGLIGFSFAVEAMARMKRVTDKKIRVAAQIRVAATVQVAIFGTSRWLWWVPRSGRASCPRPLCCEGKFVMPIGAARLSLLAFPQNWDGATIDLRFLVLPKGDPRVLPGSPSFAAANLVYRARLISGLGQLPQDADAITQGPLVLDEAPAQKLALFDELTNHFNIVPRVPVARPLPRFQKPVTTSYRELVGSRQLSPRLVSEKDYDCALHEAHTSQPAEPIPPDDSVTWGQLIAFALRQPRLALELGLIGKTTVTPGDPAFFAAGGWLYVDLDPASDFAGIQTALYAARIPPLAEARTIFTPILFPVGAAEAGGVADDIFHEAELYDRGIARLVHGAQVEDRGDAIRLAWDDEQVAEWLHRQVQHDGAGNLITDRPLGIAGYRVDVRRQGDLDWNSLLQVESLDELTIGPLSIGTFQGEGVVEVTPAQISPNQPDTYWLPSYFATWRGSSLALTDTDLAHLHDRPELIANSDAAPLLLTRE